MSRPIETKFKIYEEGLNQHNYFNKLVDERAFFEVFPSIVDYEMLEPARRQIASYAKGNLIGRDGTLMRVFEDNARIVNTNKRYLQWRLYTNDGDIRATFIKNFEADNETPGLGGQIFEIGLDVDWFGPNDLLIFEGLREIPVMVVSEPIRVGHAWKYEVKLVSDDLGAHFPIEYLEIGTKALQTGSPIGEATIRRGNIHLGHGEAFIEFEVPMTRMGWEMKVTDNAYLASKNYRLNVNPDLKPESQRDIENYFQSQGVRLNSNPMETGILYNSLEMKFQGAVNHQKDLWLTYGRSAGRFSGRFLDGMTERPLEMGPGLTEFMESSQILDHNPESNIIELLQEQVPPLWHDKVDPENRVLDIYTGTGGLKNWQRDARALDIAGVLQTEGLNYGMEDGFFPGRQGVALNKKQYRAVYLEPFGLIRVHYLPFLDSTEVETRTYRGLPLTSYEYIVFNFGYGDGREGNIYIANNDEVEQYGYSIGTWSPVGPVLGKGGVAGRFHNGLGRENAFMYIHECMFGLVVKDTGYMIWIRPTVV